ncbi:uncharacterized protein LOC123716090 [Pieris brassicae]|uniref:Uncharacterized protein n=1 Tax=Pieris brassicae TaxID=7116 RepID=A0A9P0XEE7_PIEBR|nr:uncharacterized protein LOC123716090 [Pieris brassicae]CAH4031794.1 unnamed protein product [Pieris brassicae]
MSPIIFLLLASAGCMAHYRGYQGRNLIEKEEHHPNEGILVECPVCYNAPWQFNPDNGNPKCNITIGTQRYKKCDRGSYFNEVCGRRDCYRGPGEPCTEKMEEDEYGAKCAFGYDCDFSYHVCTGIGFSISIHDRLSIPRLYPLRPLNEAENQAKSMLLI